MMEMSAPEAVVLMMGTLGEGYGLNTYRRAHNAREKWSEPTTNDRTRPRKIAGVRYGPVRDPQDTGGCSQRW